MIKKILRHLSPATHMVTKIWLFSVTVATITILLLAMLFNLLMHQNWLDQAIEQTETSTSVTSIAIADSYTQTMMRFVEICSTESFQRLYSQFVVADTERQTQLNNEIQSTLNALVNQNVMVRSAVIMNRQGVCLRPLSHTLDMGVMTYSLGYGSNVFQGVSILPRQASPIHGLHDVMPIAIPLCTLPGTKMICIADGLEDSNAMLYLFVDTEMVNTLMQTYAAQGVTGRLYLVSSQGDILNYRQDEILPHDNDRQLLSHMMSDIAVGKDKAGMVELDGKHVFWHCIGDTSMFVVDVIPTALLSSTLTRTTAKVPRIILGCILLISLATFITSITITKPLRKLMGTVQAIETGSYHKSMVLPQRDEIGQLSVSIDTMYDTIQNQITEIRQERQAKDNAEIRLISEQINPHFLYNTLESINMEVYSNHPESASAMIQNLGEFLRIGLNFGSKTITVSRELEHVQAYVNIMNNRFNHRIVFSSVVDEGCMQREILKIILQPLVENSIRHGFQLDSQAASLDDQFISVEVHETPDGGMTMQVIDNGIGIDVVKAERMLHADPAKQRHVGLNNVYQRLVMYYGPEAKITFDSIPYFRNTVCIHLPPPSLT